MTTTKDCTCCSVECVSAPKYAIFNAGLFGTHLASYANPDDELAILRTIPRGTTTKDKQVLLIGASCRQQQSEGAKHPQIRFQVGVGLCLRLARQLCAAIARPQLRRILSRGRTVARRRPASTGCDGSARHCHQDTPH